MKALILAAGLGTRLAPITDTVPKSLVPVNGKPILIKQIENLHENGISDITIISGYKADAIESVIGKTYSDIEIINSKAYAETNNMYSSYLAKDIMQNQSFLMMNADVYYDSSVITELLLFKYPNAIVTDIGTYNEESMKVEEEGGRIVKISKQVTADKAYGTSIDVYKFSPEASKKYFDVCTDYIENKKELKLWSEVALNDILSEIEFKVCPLNGRWYEIDNHDDLAAAERLFKDS